jgi:hypothetical protein
MKAKIYISAEAMATVNTIKDLDYYDRVSLSDDGPDLTVAPGYFLNTNALDLAELPIDAEVAMHLTPADAATYHSHVAMPVNLRGVIFLVRQTCPAATPRSSPIGRRWYRQFIIAQPCTSRTR